MKKLFYTKTLIAAAVAIAAVIGIAQDQPAPTTGDAALPANIQPGTPLADVVKLLHADVDVSTIKNFIANCTGTFNLDADTIIFLKDEGLPSDVINSMMDHDKAVYAAAQTPAPVATQVAAAPDDTAAPGTPVTVNYFYDTLTPYGSWVDVDGYGRCWRPTAVIYDSGWRPYCDRGHWVYTDTGWYWDSDYSWGITFHYGRWFRDSRFGWCWYPDTEWAPSWVTWRSSDDYCGWAPLPPFAVFRPGAGFFYRGAACAADFDFGLDADFFIFVAPEHFCDRHPRQFCAEPTRARQIFHQTTVINNYNVHNTTIVNNGISVTRVSAGLHRPIEPVRVGSLPDAGRQGWRGEVTGGVRASGRSPANHPAANSRPMENDDSNRRQNLESQPRNPSQNPGGTPPVGQPGDRSGQRDHSLNAGNPHTSMSAPAAFTPQRTQPQFSAPVTTERSAPQNEFRQTRTGETPVVAAPSQNEQREPRTEPTTETRSPSPPAQTQGQQPGTARGSDHSSSERSSDNNRQNQNH